MTHEQSQQFEEDKVGELTHKAEIFLENMKMQSNDLIEYYLVTGNQDSMKAVRSIRLALMHLKVGV